MNDLIYWICEEATKRFGGNDDLFNAAGFSQELCKIAGVRGEIDGRIVRALLTGRPDIMPLQGGHYKLFRLKGLANG